MENRDVVTTESSDDDIIEVIVDLTSTNVDRQAIDLTLDRPDRKIDPTATDRSIDLTENNRSNRESIVLGNNVRSNRDGIVNRDRSKHYTIDLTNAEVNLCDSSDDDDVELPTSKQKPSPRSFGACRSTASSVGVTKKSTGKEIVHASPNKRPRYHSGQNDKRSYNGHVASASVHDVSSQRHYTTKNPTSNEHQLVVVDLYSSSDEDECKFVPTPPARTVVPVQSAVNSVGATITSPKEMNKKGQTIPIRSPRNNSVLPNNVVANRKAKKRSRDIPSSTVNNLLSQQNVALKKSRKSKSDDPDDLEKTKPPTQAAAVEAPKKVNDLIKSSPNRTPPKHLVAKTDTVVNNCRQNKRSPDSPDMPLQRKDTLKTTSLPKRKLVDDDTSTVSKTKHRTQALASSHNKTPRNDLVEKNDEVVNNRQSKCQRNSPDTRKSIHDDAYDTTERKPRARAVAVETPKEASNVLKSSPNKCPRKDLVVNTDTVVNDRIKKRPYDSFVLSAAVDEVSKKASEKQNRKCDHSRSPSEVPTPQRLVKDKETTLTTRGSVSSVPSHAQSQSSKTFTGLGVIRPSLIMLKYKSIDSTSSNQSKAEKNATEYSHKKKLITSEGSTDFIRNSVVTSASPRIPKVNPPVLEEIKTTRKTIKKVPPLKLSPEPSTCQPLEDDDSSDPADYEFSNSQSSSSSGVIRQKHSSKKVSPTRLCLRPRVAGKAAVKDIPSTVSDNTIDHGISIETNILDVKSVPSDRSEHRSVTVKDELTTIKTRPDPIGKDTSVTKLVQLAKLSKKVTKSTDHRSLRIQRADIWNGLSLEPNVSSSSDDSENSDDQSDDEDMNRKSISLLNTNISNMDGSITINWKYVPSNANYLHYSKIDEMIANKAKEGILYSQTTTTIKNERMVLGGESRFFASRLSKHCDSVQWVPSIEQHSRQVKREYCSTYLPDFTDTLRVR